MSIPPIPASVRLDKWLWAVRLFKTRTLAAHACRSGHVRVDDVPARPSREVRPGDVIVTRTGGVLRTVRVRAVQENRLGAVRVPEFLEDLTPPEEYEQARLAREASAIPRREPGSGRPTKRERRLLDAFLHLPVAPDGTAGGVNPD